MKDGKRQLGAEHPFNFHSGLDMILQTHGLLDCKKSSISFLRELPDRIRESSQKLLLLSRIKRPQARTSEARESHP